MKLNKWEKEVQASLLASEEDVIKALELSYKRSLNDIINQVKLFEADITMIDEAIASGEAENVEQLLSVRRSKVYQKQFQEALQAQVEGILDKMHSDEYKTINDYLNGCYSDAFIGSEYAMSMQGIPNITPINQASVTKAVLLDSKVSGGFYNKLGIDVGKLKPLIMAEITRGIATSSSYADIARQLDMVSASGLANAKRIVRTEGHRIQQAAWMDSANDAKAHGADLVRIWSSVLDGRTRETHRKYDGTQTEVGVPFNLGGKKIDAPGYFGVAAEDCNCRCVAISRPRWALDSGISKYDAFTGEIRTFEKPEDYAQFKEWYWSKENTEYMNFLSSLENKYGTQNFEDLLAMMSDKEYDKFKRLESASPLWNASKQVTQKREESFAPEAKLKETKSEYDKLNSEFRKIV